MKEALGINHSSEMKNWKGKNCKQRLQHDIR